MCGIFCSFSKSTEISTVLEKCRLCENSIKRRGPDYYSSHEIVILDYTLIFLTSILWLQGEDLVKQPLCNEKSVFIFNGDIFGGNISDEDRKVYGDTTLLFNMLNNSTTIAGALSTVEGPYAFIYLDKSTSKLYFSRDIFGRRSLLIGKIQNGLILTSVAVKDINCIELPAIGIFSYDLQFERLTLMPWNLRNNNFSVKLQELEVFLSCHIDVIETKTDMANKSFYDPLKEDLDIFGEIKLLQPHTAFEILLDNAVFSGNVKKLYNLLDNAIAKRIATQPKYCKNCITNRKICHHALVGVLFSGGLDCTILALLSDKFSDSHRSIDLINVAFEKGSNYNTPDRKTGLESFEELKRLRPNRVWNFLEINVSLEELNKERTNHIRHLIHPLNSILDDSLGCALWFASMGRAQSYETPCRVLLVGMGADELFGGYTRHRAALKNNGWIGLHNTLNEDWQNISHRNLARDDRVVSDHGKQLRTPYLDENVVEFVRNLNCWEKTYPSNELSTGVGDKILLRTLAYHLGLRGASVFKKRALQFGSRIANSKENAHDISPRL